jgi:RND superfamily putative drug exporter
LNRFARLLTGRRSSWIALVLAAVAAALAFGLGSGADAQTSPGSGLPSTAESARVAVALAALPGADSTTAVLVYTRDDGDLSDDDVAKIERTSQELADLSSVDRLPPVSVSADRTTAILVVPLAEIADVDLQAQRADDIRSTARDGLPAGMTALLTGPEGFAVDIAAVFDGADFTLLLVTVIVVAVLLLITYRSPWLWLVPLAVVGLADGVAGIAATRVAAAFGIQLDASVTGILSVLVFGAGTNYALLLIARYRDELRRHEDRREAMVRAWRAAAPAIVASGGTVVLSLCTLLLAQLEGNRALGLACAVGVLIAMAFALLVLPAAMVLFGRGLFWPLIPRTSTPGASERGPWHRLATGVSRRPLAVALLGALVLGCLALGVPGMRIGLAQTERFTATPEAVTGQELIADAFPAGSGSPAIVVGPASAVDDLAAVAEGVDGVVSATPGESDADIVSLSVVLDSAAETEQSFETVRALRAELHPLDALVGGLDAQSLDTDELQQADQDLVIPLILALVLLVLVLLLRALVAPVLLLITVVASFFASLGASSLLFDTVFGFPAVDTNVVLFSFLFLVALGVDYNIFLVTRAREESIRHGTREGMVRAVSSTGGVITSAGILLAAVFAVLGVLPLITLTQIGIIVCIGVLLDTLLVRTLIVPALAFLTGERFWFPSVVHRPNRVEG